MLERLHDECFPNIMTDSASLEYYTVEPASITHQAIQYPKLLRQERKFEGDDEISAFTRLRSEAVGVPIFLDNILG